MADQGVNRPNILFILSDDQGAWALGCAGNDEIETPNLDRLAVSGMRFENFFCTSPVCSPARASLVTGRIPSQHGVLDWLSAGNTTAAYEPARDGELTEYLEGQAGYTDHLAAAGYDCALSGKWHLGDSHHPQKSFDHWAVHAKGGGPYYNAPMIREGEVVEEEAYVTDVITDNALGWLDARQAGDAPFYLGVHYTAPHAPWGREHHPTETWDRYNNECPFTSVPDGLTPPEWIRCKSFPVETARKRREVLSGYYAAVTEMDRNIGRLLDWLDAHGLRRQTLVLFTSDNGMNMGHHGVYGKGNATFPLNMFDESVKVPFIISHPGQIPEGVTTGAMASQYDFMPTLLDYVGIENPEADDLPGRSVAPLLRGGKTDTDGEVVVFDEYGPVRMIRSHDWKYVERYALGYGPDELYDLRQDPGEQVNLVGDPAYAETEAALRARLGDWFARYARPETDGSKFLVTGSGQFDRCETDTPERPAFDAGRVKGLL